MKTALFIFLLCCAWTTGSLACGQKEFHSAPTSPLSAMSQLFVTPLSEMPVDHDADDAHHGHHCPGHCTGCSGSVSLVSPWIGLSVLPPSTGLLESLPPSDLTGFFLDIFIPPRILA